MTRIKNYSFYLIVIILLVTSLSTWAQPSWRWARTATNTLESSPVAVDNKGNVFAAGRCNSTAIFGTLSVPAGGFVWAKYDPSGTLQWAGSITSGVGSVYNITTDTAGDLIIFGYFTSPSIHLGSIVLTNPGGGGYSDLQYFVAKVSPAGTVLWAVNDGHVDIGLFGAVATDDSGNIYVSTQFSFASMTIGSYTLTNADASGSSSDFFLAKYSPSGTLQWATSAGGSTGSEDAFGITVASGNVYVAGTFWSTSFIVGGSVLSNPSGLALAFLARFSPAGVPLWADASTGPSVSEAAGVTHDDVGNVYMVGYFYDTVINFGASTFSRAYHNNTQTGFIVKYTPADAIAWGKTMSSATAASPAYSISYSKCGRIWISGGYTQPVVFAPGDTLALPPAMSAVYDPVFIAAYDLDGNAKEHAALASGGDDNFNQVACDAIGNVYLCSDFGGTQVMGPDTLHVSVGEQMYVAKFGKLADTLSETKDTTICSGGTLTLTASAGANYYLWDDSETAQTRIVSASGVYMAYGSYCGDTVVAIAFHVSVSPPPSAIAGLSTLGTGCSYTYTDTILGGIWSVSATTIASINPSTGHTTTLAPGVFTITYTLSPGCTVTKTVTVTSTPCTTSLPAIADNHLIISPNPATDYLTITASSGAYTSCTIINNLGQVVMTQPIVAAQTRVGVSELPAGIYYLRLTGEGDTRVVQVVKE